MQIVDVAVPSDCNVSMKETEKIKKYKDLSVELSYDPMEDEMWSYSNSCWGIGMCNSQVGNVFTETCY